MATQALRERLARDLGGWLADGLISAETHALLARRYSARSFGLAQAVKYVGISGGVLAFFGLLGLVGAVSGSLWVAAGLLCAVGVGVTATGIRLSRDALGRYAASSKIVLALGAVTATMGVGVAAHALDVRDATMVVMTGAVILPAIGVLAYRFGNIFLLIVGLLGFFHWVGSWTSMFGRSEYDFDIQDPRLMSAAALGAVLLGVVHERRFRERTGRFYQAYEALGLMYLNLSLLILTIYDDERWASPEYWIAVLAVAAVAQIVAGARLHNGLFTGFGVTSLAVNVYTRYYEHFWHRTHEGVFFLVGGVVLFGAGAGSEIVLRRQRGAP